MLPTHALSIPVIPNQWLNSPTAQVIAAALATVGALVLLYLVLRSLRWAAYRIKPILAGAAVAALCVWLYWSVQMDQTSWLAVAGAGLGMLIGLALFMSRG